MIKANVNIFLIISLCLLALTACRHGEDLPVPSPEVETVQLIISVPNTAAGSRAIGDPGTAVDEGADWDRLAVILAYKSKVQTTTITQEQFNALPVYNDNSNFKLLAIDAEPGTVYIYGVTYSAAADDAGNLEAAIEQCATDAAVKALTISNDYSKLSDGTIDYAKFVSVATGYYRGEAATGNQPAAFTIQQGGTGQVGNIPTMTLTRLATKLDIQWDAADAYEQGYTDVKVTSFSYQGKQYGRLFPGVTLPTEPTITNTSQSWTFYNTSEISQRNGRVYHYTFTDGILESVTGTGSNTTPCVTFKISAKKSGVTIPDDGYSYTLNFTDALKQAAWYKVNATIKGITGAGTITFDDASVGG